MCAVCTSAPFHIVVKARDCASPRCVSFHITVKARDCASFHIIVKASLQNASLRQHVHRLHLCIYRSRGVLRFTAPRGDRSFVRTTILDTSATLGPSSCARRQAVALALRRGGVSGFSWLGSGFCISLRAFVHSSAFGLHCLR